MWIPDRFELPLEDAYALLARGAAADLLTPTSEGIAATFLPLLLDAAAGVLRGHLARQNPHVSVLRAHPEASSLVIAHGPGAYISPSWYPSKFANPRVVPTWDYTVVHVHGRARLVDDQAWLLAHLRALSDHHEAGFDAPWSIDDAPADYIAGMARAVVGAEVVIDRVEAKAKQSQNRSHDDVAGLRTVGDHDAATAVAEANGAMAHPPTKPTRR